MALFQYDSDRDRRRRDASIINDPGHHHLGLWFQIEDYRYQDFSVFARTDQDIIQAGSATEVL